MSFRPHRVVVAGGGFAAAEAVLALREFAGEHVHVALVTPEPELPFRPAATAAAFAPADAAPLVSTASEPACAPPAPAVPAFDLTTLAAETGAQLRFDRVEAVASDVRRVRLASGAQVEYDSLVLATGARSRSAVPGATTFRDHRDMGLVTGLVSELHAGTVQRLVVVAPPGAAWPLPAYELALLTAAEIDAAGLAAEVTLVTPERAPLEVFGREASVAAADALEARGVQVVCNSVPRKAARHALRLADGSALPADRVLATPELRGRRLNGVPSNFGGFVPVDRAGRILGLEGVYAAGDMTDFPVKQGGLAAQQAEVIASAIAAEAGADFGTLQPAYLLRAQLFGAPSPLYLQTELDERGRPVPGRSLASEEALWWPPTTVFGRHITPWMAEHRAVA